MSFLNNDNFLDDYYKKIISLKKKEITLLKIHVFSIYKYQKKFIPDDKIPKFLNFWKDKYHELLIDLFIGKHLKYIIYDLNKENVWNEIFLIENSLL
jgi:hypothetical protein